MQGTWDVISSPVFEASALTDQEKARVLPVVRQEMLAAWNKHCVADPASQEEIMDRARYFLRNHDRSSPLKTALSLCISRR